MARSLSSLSKEELSLLDRLSKSFSQAVRHRAGITTRLHEATLTHDFAAFDEARRQDARAARECADCLIALRVLKQLLDLEQAAPPGQPPETTSEGLLHPKP